MNQYYEPLPMKPSREFFYLILMWLLFMVVSVFASVITWWLMTGQSIAMLETDLLKPDNLNAFKMIQVVSTVIMFFVPAYITARRASSHPMKRLGFVKSFKYDRLLLALGIMFCVLPLVGFMADVNKAIPLTPSLKKMFEGLESNYMEQIKKIALFTSPLDYIVALIVIAFFPAFVEEVFFRGAMQQIFLRWFVHPWLVIFITSLIFSAIHFSWYGFIPRIVLGMMLGGIFHYTGNLWYSIAAHFFNNAFMVTILYVQHLQGKPIDTEIGDSAPWWAGILSLILVIFLLRQLHRVSVTKVAPDSIAATPDTDDNRFSV
ncbi:MAG: CPBP family intramembrane metalloprotease [Bacteroidetes bacterium]|nr:CPBP family intramembrane metalloprotease [Bacteroidota bacterium]